MPVSSNFSTQRFGLRPLALALHMAFGGACLMAGTALPTPALAQAAKATHRFDIPAGPLATALNQVGATAGAGVLLSFDPALVLNVRSPALQGEYSVEEALQRLLQGSGLMAQASGSGTFVLRKAAVPAPADNAPELPTVRVVGKTEGTGSYTTGLTNTATKLDLSLRETPQSVTVLTHKRMEDQGLSEVSQVLDQATGLYFNHANVVGSDGNPVYSRGFEVDNYQVNGVPRSDRYGFKNDVADTAVYDRVEVVRGASGLLNGVGEPSGAVNLVRKLPTREFQGHVSGKVGSWDFRRVEADLSGALTESGNVRGRMVGVRQDSGTFVDRVSMNKDVLYGVVEVDLAPNTILSAGMEYQRNETTGAGNLHSAAPIFFPNGSRTGFGYTTNLAADWSSTLRENLTLFAGLEHHFDNEWKIKLDVDQDRRDYRFTVGDVSLRNSATDDAGQFRGFRNEGAPRQSSLSLHATGPYQWFGRKHELVVGGSYYRFKERSNWYNEMQEPIATYPELFRIIQTGHYPQGDLSLTGEGRTLNDQQSGLYAATRINPADGISVIVGSRLSNWKTRSDRFDAAGVTTRGDTTRQSSVLTPYAGIVVDVSPSASLYGSYTDIFQPSSLYDANGRLLDPAEGKNLEGGIKMAFLDDRLNVSAAVYKTQKDGVPEYVPGPGGSVNRGPTGAYVYRGVDGTKTTGFELEASGQLSRLWQVAAGYSEAKPVDRDGDPRLTHIPRKQFKLFTSYQPRQWLEGLTLGANLRWQDAVSSRDPYPYAQGDLTTLDLMAHYEITRNLSATLNVNNVFDKRYHTNINVGAWYGEPRSAYVNLRYRF